MSGKAKTEDIEDALTDYTAYTMVATRLHAIEAEFDDMLRDDITRPYLEEADGVLSVVGVILEILSAGFEEKARRLAEGEFGFECDMTPEELDEASDIMDAFEYIISESADLLSEIYVDDMLCGSRK